MAKKPLISIIVPTLGEEEALQLLLADLSVQEGVSFEVVIADATKEKEADNMTTLLHPEEVPTKIVRCESGRGRQLNEGVRHARGDDLLFLHADTRLLSPTLLAGGAKAMDMARRGSKRVAGHFPLRIGATANSLSFYYLEAKSRLGLPQCVNGDQGQWISREYFEEMGGMDESLPFLEDLRLSKVVSESGRWVSLPGEIVTSARRFEKEGTKARLTLNALIRIAEDISLDGFLEKAPALYRAHPTSKELILAPFFTLFFRELFSGATMANLSGLGAFASNNTWQVVSWIECAYARRRGIDSHEIELKFTKSSISFLGNLKDNFLFKILAGSTVLVWMLSAWVGSLQPFGFLRNRI